MEFNKEKNITKIQGVIRACYIMIGLNLLSFAFIAIMLGNIGAPASTVLMIGVSYLIIIVIFASFVQGFSAIKEYLIYLTEQLESKN